MDSMVEEIKPLVTEEYVFENRASTKLGGFWFSWTIRIPTQENESKVLKSSSPQKAENVILKPFDNKQNQRSW